MPIARDVAIPLREVVLRTSRSSGPGGQHANVTASRVEASFDVAASEALSEAQKARVAARCGPVFRAVAQDARSQARNRELALERLRARLAQALHVRAPRGRRRGRPRPPSSAAPPPRAGAPASSATAAGRPARTEPAGRRAPLAGLQTERTASGRPPTRARKLVLLAHGSRTSPTTSAGRR